MSDDYFRILKSNLVAISPIFNMESNHLQADSIVNEGIKAKKNKRIAEKRLDDHYYYKPWLNKREAAAYIGASTTTLDRWESAYPFIKKKVQKRGSILYSRMELDKVISGEYDV